MLLTEAFAVMSPVLVMMLLIMPCPAQRTPSNCPETYCFNRSCISVADELIESVDQSVYPCDDFYHHVCGGWIQRQFLTPERQKARSTANIKPFAVTRKMLTERPKPTDLDAVRKAKRLYASCLNHTAGNTSDTAIVQAITSRFGRWPLACGADYNVTEYNLQQFLIEAIQIGVHPLFSLEANHKNAFYNFTTRQGKRILSIGAPALTLKRENYASFSQEPEYRQIYVDTILAAARRFGIADIDMAKQDALDIVEAEETMNKFHTQFQASWLLSYERLDALDGLFRQTLNWTHLISSLATLPHIGITDLQFSEVVLIPDQHLLNATLNYFIRLPLRTQVNYIIWRFVDNLQHILVDSSEKFEAFLQQESVDETAQESRDFACIQYVSQAFHLVIHRILYEKHLPEEKLQTVKAIVKQLKEQFYSLLSGHNWIDNSTRVHIEDKIEAISTTVMYLKEATNTTFVEVYYANVTVEESNFINNVISVQKDAFAKLLQSTRGYTKVVNPVRPQQYTMQFLPTFNDIQFTSLAVQPPFFVDDAPMSLNYAGAGSIIAREIAHAVDPIGLLYHKNGTMGYWWSIPSFLEFRNRLDCLVTQYNNYFYKPAGEYVKGRLTTSENMADNLAIKLAYRAYMNYTSSRNRQEHQLPAVRYTNDRLFFIRYAQVFCFKETRISSQTTLKGRHSPYEFRVNGPLQNLDEFAAAFGCDSSDRMNPPKKCRVW